jgi:hypothetical protein
MHVHLPSSVLSFKSGSKRGARSPEREVPELGPGGGVVLGTGRRNAGWRTHKICSEDVAENGKRGGGDHGQRVGYRTFDMPGHGIARARRSNDLLPPISDNQSIARPIHHGSSDRQRRGSAPVKIDSFGGSDESKELGRVRKRQPDAVVGLPAVHHDQEPLVCVPADERPGMGVGDETRWVVFLSCYCNLSPPYQNGTSAYAFEHRG